MKKILFMMICLIVTTASHAVTFTCYYDLDGDNQPSNNDSEIAKIYIDSDYKYADVIRNDGIQSLAGFDLPVRRSNDQSQISIDFNKLGFGNHACAIILTNNERNFFKYKHDICNYKNEHTDYCLMTWE